MSVWLIDYREESWPGYVWEYVMLWDTLEGAKGWFDKEPGKYRWYKRYNKHYANVNSWSHNDEKIKLKWRIREVNVHTAPQKTD